MEFDPEDQVSLAPIGSTTDIYLFFELIDRFIKLFNFLSGYQIIEIPNQEKSPMQTQLKILDQFPGLFFSLIRRYKPAKWLR